MSKVDRPLPDPSDRVLSSEPENSRAWWFLGTLVVLRNPVGAPRCPTIIELTVPPGGSPPRHIHDTLDDNFLLLEGEVVVRCGERTIIARSETYVALPHGVDHTFRVTSALPARMLLLHASDEFLGFIEAAGTPTHERRLPPIGEHDVTGMRSSGSPPSMMSESSAPPWQMMRPKSSSNPSRPGPALPHSESRTSGAVSSESDGFSTA